MGKNLKGRELGKGIVQKKDGKYLARFTSRRDNRIEKTFSTVPEARNWLGDARYEDRHGDYSVPSAFTVDQWFDFWINNIVGE